MSSFTHYYTQCEHGLCGVHLVRELTTQQEASTCQKSWAAPLKQLLLEIKAAVEREREAGGQQLGAAEQAALTARYDELVKHGVEKHPPVGARAATGTAATSEGAEPQGRVCQKQARNLLRRMQQRKEEVLRFMTEFAVPFDNNQAERDLRMIK